jgi:hypothetical protein
MGGGGLRILPKKSWNVYNPRNRQRVARDEARAAKEQAELDAVEAKVVATGRLGQLRDNAARRAEDGDAFEHREAPVSATMTSAGADGEGGGEKKKVKKMKRKDRDWIPPQKSEKADRLGYRYDAKPWYAADSTSTGSSSSKRRADEREEKFGEDTGKGFYKKRSQHGDKRQWRGGPSYVQTPDEEYAQRAQQRKLYDNPDLLKEAIQHARDPLDIVNAAKSMQFGQARPELAMTSDARLLAQRAHIQAVQRARARARGDRGRGSRAVDPSFSSSSDSESTRKKKKKKKKKSKQKKKKKKSSKT